MEEEFVARKRRSDARLQSSIQPLNRDGARASSHGRGGASADAGAGGARGAADALGRQPIRPGGAADGAEGDVQAMSVGTVGWDAVGDLQRHVDALKEMVLLPLLYPEVFATLGVSPPRGVLFHGPPGTGKTLVARALAHTCGSSGQPVAFFMRKGADVLSKWVGEAEKQLRLLFTEATRLQARWRRSSNPQLCLARQAPPPTPSHTLALPRTAFDHLLRRDRRPRARALFETGLHPRVDRVDASRAHGRPRLARPGDPHRRDEPHRLPRCCASSPRPVRPRAPVRVAQRVGQIRDPAHPHEVMGATARRRPRHRALQPHAWLLRRRSQGTLRGVGAARAARRVPAAAGR